MIPFEKWGSLSLALGAGILLFTGQWTRAFPIHQKSGWRDAAAALRSATRGDANFPIVCPSPFVEARSPVWRPDLPASGFLYSHLLVYRPGGRTFSFPFALSNEEEQYARRFVSETALPAGRFAIYGGDRNVMFWRDWFTARPELASWRYSELAAYGDVRAVIFRPVAKRN